MTGLKVFYEHQWMNRKREEKSKLKIKNVPLFIVERFHLFIQKKSILLLYEWFLIFLILFLFTLTHTHTHTHTYIYIYIQF